MKLRVACVVAAFFSLILSLTPLTVAQTSTQTVSALPRLVRFGATVKDLNGSPITGVVGITFALYSEQTGGAPLWLETQNVTADSNGHYAALLGSTKLDGLPTDLFTSEQARWVGVQVSGQAEQPRVLLVSAPYALKAGDAETIGGLPPSAFVKAETVASTGEGVSGAPNSTTNAAPVSRPANRAAGSVQPPAATDVTTTGGKANFLPAFNGASTIIDSVVFQSGAGTTAKVGINTTTPATTLDVNGAATVRGAFSLPDQGTATATKGVISHTLNQAASAFNSGTKKAVNQTFRWQTEPAGNNTSLPSGTLNLLFAEGASAFAETGLHIASNGLITFAKGQTFPVGTITGQRLNLSGAAFICSNQAATGTCSMAEFDPAFGSMINAEGTWAANVSLPQGAEVTALTLCGHFFESGSSITATLNMAALTTTTGNSHATPVAMASIASSGAANLTQCFQTTTITNATIDNTMNQYYVVVAVPDNSIEFSTVQINY